MKFFSSYLTLGWILLIMISVYYLGVRRSFKSSSVNSKIGGALKVLALVCLGCLAVAALVHTSGRTADHSSEPISFAYVLPAASPKATAETLKQLEVEFMKAAADKGSQGYMSYYADDAVEVPNGAPLIQGKVEIAKGMGFLDDKNNRLLWSPVGADISSSGDLGYTYGNFEFHSKDKTGNAVVEHGKYTSIWKRQKDGSWKVVLDMGNASPDPKKS